MDAIAFKQFAYEKNTKARYEEFEFRLHYRTNDDDRLPLKVWSMLLTKLESALSKERIIPWVQFVHFHWEQHDKSMRTTRDSDGNVLHIFKKKRCGNCEDRKEGIPWYFSWAWSTEMQLTNGLPFIVNTTSVRIVQRKSFISQSKQWRLDFSIEWVAPNYEKAIESQFNTFPVPSIELEFIGDRSLLRQDENKLMTEALDIFSKLLDIPPEELKKKPIDDELV